MAVAVDAEFLKMGGAVLARSVAFFPFSSVDATGAADRTHRPAVIQLTPAFVLHNCDVLPSGHSIRPLCEELSPGLDIFFPPRGFGQVGLKLKLHAVCPQTAQPLLRRRPMCLDPYTIPNTSRLSDSGAILNLYSSPSEVVFAVAVREILKLTAPYGGGKPHQPSLAGLLRHDAAAFQRFLRFRFRSAEDWGQWVRRSYDVSAAALHQVSSSLTAAAAQPSVYGAPSLGLTTCESLLEFSHALCDAWSSQRTQGPQTKFYAYGSADQDVLRAAARLSCMHRRNDSPASSSVSVDSPSAVPLQQQPADCITSTMQITLRDVTALSAFRAAGFEAEHRMTPRLRAALSKVANRSRLAQELLAAPDEHNPLWDAAALAAVCQALLPSL